MRSDTAKALPRGRDSIVHTLLTIKDVQEKLKVGRTTLYRMIRDGHLPAPASITGCCSGHGSSRWLASQIDDWLAERFGSNNKTQQN
ncbi:prophage CP4-57 regulatory protein-like protein [mine drainage metagenome]|uniref:Prophage CP4-57 regulatory protein-like protein n=1 Tax=mine drainage metagenome TaxID=410659 RepID=T1BPX4_9ZZZZ